MVLPERDEKHYVYEMAAALNELFGTELDPVLSDHHYKQVKRVLVCCAGFIKDCEVRD